MDDRLRNLLNREIDGRLGPGERAELDRALAADATLRVERDALREALRRLAADAEPPPPPGFRESVLARARIMPPRRRAVRRRQAVLALAAGLAAVVLAGRALLDPGPEAAGDLTGTLAPDPVVQVTPIDGGLQVEIDLPDGPAADLVLDAGRHGPLRARTDDGWAGGSEAGRIVVPGAGRGRTTVWLQGDPAPDRVRVLRRRRGHETPVTVQAAKP